MTMNAIDRYTLLRNRAQKLITVRVWLLDEDNCDDDELLVDEAYAGWAACLYGVRSLQASYNLGRSRETQRVRLELL